MNKMACPHVNVLPPQLGDQVRIYKVPKIAITQI